MGAINNPHIYSTTSGTTPTTWITDDIDYPHSGLIKALSQGIRGNYAIKGSATDFDITLASSTYTTIAVTTGKAFRDGKLVTITALSATNLTGIHATEDVYQLLVAQANNTMTLRGSNSVTNRIPDLTDGDIPIAVIKLAAGSAQGSTGTSDRLIQFLTTSKVSNDLSIGYDNSGYTETANIVGASGVTTITAASSTDVKVKLAGTAAGDTFEVIDSAAEVQFKVQGDGEVSTQGNITVGGNIIKASDGGSAITLDTSDNVTIGNNLKVGGNIIQASDGGNTITLDTSDNVTIAGDLTVGGGDVSFPNGANATLSVATTGGGTDGRDLTISAGSAPTGSTDQNGGDLILNAGGGDGTGTSIITFNTKKGDADTVAERMRIHTDGKVGIGENAPSAPLHVKYTGTGSGIILESTDTGTSGAPDLVLLRNSASPLDDDVIGNIQFKGIDDGDDEETFVSIVGQIADVTDASIDGRLKIYIKEAGSSSNHVLEIAEGTLGLEERAAVGSLQSNGSYGRIWIKNDNPNNLYFTNGDDNNIQLTNGTTGPLLTGKHSIWIPAEAISPRSNAGCADLTTLAAATSGRPDIRHLAFDKDSDEHAQFTIAMPKMWDEGTITAQFYWTSTSSTTSHDVTWGIQGVSLSNDDVIDTAFGTAVTIHDTVIAAKDLHISSATGNITIGGSPAAGDLTCFQVYRDVDGAGTAANDDLNVDALLMGVKLFYTINAPNDE
tara:strand:- start:24027 stop:26201 length:2175 start_codon:yes stop_codon:yes gene_type:complete